MPDPHSGQPRLPRAPADTKSGDPEAKQPYHSRKVLTGPKDGGPTLEWHYGDRKMQRWSAGVMVVVCLIFATIKWGGFASSRPTNSPRSP